MSKIPVRGVLFLLTLSAAPAWAGSATVDVVERGAKGRTVTHRFVVALSDDGRPSKIESASGRVRHKLSVQWTSPKGQTAMLQLDLRQDRGADSVSIAVTNRVPLGKRVVVGRVPRSAGGAVQVAVVLSR